jgi:hypothetical protein
MVYAVDFDGYLCESAWPDIGEPHNDIIAHFINLKACGHKLILNTCREGEMLNQAKAWCADHGLVFDAYNENLPERIAQYGKDCRKISADWYCDDKNYWLMPERVHT